MIARHDALRGRVGRSDERMHFAARLELDLQCMAAATSPILTARAPPSSRPTPTPFDLERAAVRATLSSSRRNATCWCSPPITSFATAGRPASSCRSSPPPIESARCAAGRAVVRAIRDGRGGIDAGEGGRSRLLDAALPRHPALAGAADGSAAAAAAVLCRRRPTPRRSMRRCSPRCARPRRATARRSLRRCSRRCRS